MPRKETYAGPLSAQAQQDLVSEGIENFELPKSVVMKIAKSALPDNVKLQKETVLSLVKGSTVFINYLAAISHDVAQSKQHKSISASDVLKALETIEFGDMVGKLQNELNIYRELSKNDKPKKAATNGASSSSKKISASASAAAGPSSGSASAPPKGKGKEKEKEKGSGNPLPPPFTSAPLVTHPRVAGLSHSASAMDVDEDESSVSAAGAARNAEGDGDEGEGEGQEEDDGEERDDDDDDIEDEDDEDQEEEELVDKEALEEEELRRDSKRLGGEGKIDEDEDDIMS